MSDIIVLIGIAFLLGLILGRILFRTDRSEFMDLASRHLALYEASLEERGVAIPKTSDTDEIKLRRDRS